jgi:pectinesterase inhibitor-like protein
MASAIRLSLPFSLLVIYFLAIHPTLSNAQNTTEDMINKICRSVEDYGFCKQTFEDNLLSPVADIVDLTHITILQSSSNATNTLDFIRHLLGNMTTDDDDVALKNALTECENAYKVLAGSFQNAFLFFNYKDYDSVLFVERGTPRVQASCTSTFNTPPNPFNPLDERNRQMRILITMAVVAATELTSSS